MNVYQVYCVQDLNPPDLDYQDLLEELYSVFTGGSPVLSSLEAAKKFAEQDAKKYVEDTISSSYNSGERVPKSERDTTVLWELKDGHHYGELSKRPDTEWFVIIHEVEVKN